MLMVDAHVGVGCEFWLSCRLIWACGGLRGVFFDWWCYGGCWGLSVIGGWVFGVLGYGGILEQLA